MYPRRRLRYPVVFIQGLPSPVQKARRFGGGSLLSFGARRFRVAFACQSGAARGCATGPCRGSPEVRRRESSPAANGSPVTGSAAVHGLAWRFRGSGSAPPAGGAVARPNTEERDSLHTCESTPTGKQKATPREPSSVRQWQACPNLRAFCILLCEAGMNTERPRSRRRRDPRVAPALAVARVAV